MSNLIFVCWRRKEDALGTALLEQVAGRIAMVDPAGHPPRVAMGAQDACCLTGPQGAARMEGTSAFLGAFAGSSSGWERPGQPVPDGTFALVRAGEATVELCSDFAGTRTLWYVLTDRHFYASTSQRALTCLLGSFELNKPAIGWFLSSGTLGPRDAWDTRIRRLPADARLILDRQAWTLDLRATPITFAPRPMARQACVEELSAVMRETVRSYDFGTANWILPLSGGVDSRCILASLHEGGARPRTVTWGKAASITQPGNDAFVARQLAEHFGVPHDYLLTEDPDAAPDEVVERFLEACGGTMEQMSAYLDGMRLWASLPAQGVDGIIRGDEGFPFRPVHTLQQARTGATLVMLSDFMDEGLAEALGDGPQVLPEDLSHREGESVIAYRNRIYHAFRIPVGLAALTDVKTPFVEVANPLLSRRILEFIRQMPDSCTADRSVYTTAVRAMAPTIPFATMAADDDRCDYLWSAPYAAVLAAELDGDKARMLFPEAFLVSLRNELDKGRPSLGSSRSFRAAVKRIIPPLWIRKAKALLGGPDEVPEARILVLRAALICRTVRMYEEDGRMRNA